MIDYKILAENIAEIAKERGFKIKDLEDTVGVSNGYFSRFAKLKQASGLKLDLLNDVAKCLHTSIDYMLNYKDRMLCEDDKRIVNFLDSIAKSIRTYNPVCRVVTLDLIKSYDDSPLMTEIFTYDVMKTKDDDAHEVFKYNSLFKKQMVNMEKLLYEPNSGRIWTDEYSGTEFLITKNRLGLQSQNGVDWYSGFELYMANEDKIVAVCNAYRDLSEKFYAQLEIIYGLASERNSSIHLDKDTRSFIDEYIKKVGEECK